MEEKNKEVENTKDALQTEGGTEATKDDYRQEREILLSQIVVASGKVGALTQEMSRIERQLNEQKEALSKLIEKAKTDLVA